MSPYRFAVVAALCALSALSACRQQGLPVDARASAAPAAAGTPVPTVGPDDALPGTVPAGPAEALAAGDPAPLAFDPASVPESGATLPPFPLLAAPDGLTGQYEGVGRVIAFGREHMIAGDTVIALEGRVFRQRYRLDGGRHVYSAPEFHRGYADAIAALGGVRVGRARRTPAVNGARAAVERRHRGACARQDCENRTYLIRQGGREYWIRIGTGTSTGTGAPPLHGQVTVLEQLSRVPADR